MVLGIYLTIIGILLFIEALITPGTQWVSSWAAGALLAVGIIEIIEHVQKRVK